MGCGGGDEGIKMEIDIVRSEMQSVMNMEPSGVEVDSRIARSACCSCDMHADLHLHNSYHHHHHKTSVYGVSATYIRHHADLPLSPFSSLPFSLSFLSYLLFLYLNLWPASIYGTFFLLC